MTPEAMRVAVFGSGDAALTFGAAVQQTSGVLLRGIAGLDEENGRRARGVLDCRLLTEQQVLESEPLDAAIVCGNAETRLAQIGALIDRGLHVLVERPLPPDPAGARALFWNAYQKSRTVVVGSPYRYAADVSTLKTMLDSELLGEIVDFEMTFCSGRDLRQRERPGTLMQGVILEKGWDAVDLVQYLSGAVTEIFAVENRRVNGVLTDETARLAIRTTQATAYADLSWTIEKPRDSYLEIYGSRGAVRLGWDQSYWRLNDREWEPFGKGFDPDRTIRALFQNFVASLRGEEELRCHAEDAISVVEVIDAAYASLRHREWRQAAPGRHYLRVVRG
jgi:predicted dehydrogenase